MIITVTLNPALDHILLLPELNLGKFTRAIETIRMPGGKGINVACSLAVLGEEVVATGFLGGQSCHGFEGTLRKIGVTTNFTYIDQEVRTDFFVMEQKKNRQSLIVEKGTSIELRYLNSFRANYERLLSSADLVEIGGSLPNGVTASFIKELVAAASKKKVKVALNLPEKILLEAMQGGKPYIVYPDLRETKRMFGEDIYKPEGRRKMAAELHKRGVEIVILKYGNLNYVVSTKDECWEGEIELGASAVMIGIRDAVLAGFIFKYQQSQSIGEALKYGLGAGRSTAKHKMNFPNSKKEVEEFLLMAKVRKVT
ncbi:1-phosphofructokinase family hexose kinase [Candidatus Margulisiibacteriota bacterium]